MPLLSLPNEILLMIVQEVIERRPGDTTSDEPEGLSRLTHFPFSAQLIRLTRFRRLAGACHSLADLARTVFWMKIEVSTGDSRFLEFVDVLNGRHAKPACVRQLKLFSLEYKYEVAPPADLVKLTVRLVLHRLSGNLDVLEVACTRDKPGKVLFEAIEESETMQVRTLKVYDRPDGRDTSSFFRPFQSIVHLRLSISRHDDASTFLSPLTAMQLQSLVIDFDHNCFFSSKEGPDHVLTAINMLAKWLKPVCASLKSLHLRLDRQFAGVSREAYIASFQAFLALSPSTLSSLLLSAKYGRHVYDQPSLANLANANVFPSHPLLRHLTIDGFSISARAFRQMGCLQLQTLKVVVLEGGAMNGVESMRSLIRSLDLPELSHLKELDISFNEPDPYDYAWGLYGEWHHTRETWIPVKEACAAKQIKYAIAHPGEPVEEDDGEEGGEDGQSVKDEDNGSEW